MMTQEASGPRRAAPPDALETLLPLAHDLHQCALRLRARPHTGFGLPERPGNFSPGCSPSRIASHRRKYLGSGRPVVSCTGRRGILVMPLSIASTSPKSETIQGKGWPSGYPLPLMRKGVAERSTTMEMPGASPPAAFSRSSPSTQTVASCASSSNAPCRAGQAEPTVTTGRRPASNGGPHR